MAGDGGNGAVGGSGRMGDQRRSIEGCMLDWGRERGIQHLSDSGDGEEEQGHRITPDDEHRGSRDGQSQEEEW